MSMEDLDGSLMPGEFRKKYDAEPETKSDKKSDLKNDLNNPLAAAPGRHIILKDKFLIDLELGLLCNLTSLWQKDIEESRTGLTALFNRSLRGGSLRRMLVGVETDLGVKPHPAALIETRLVNVAAEAARLGHDLKEWDDVLPKLKAIVISSDTENAGPLKMAKLARSILRGPSNP